MKNTVFTFILCGALLSLFAGCASVDNAHRAKQSDLNKEGTVVFTRPAERSLFGTRSIRDYVEVTQERSYTNAAGQLVVELTLRNYGKDHWYNALGKTPETIALAARCDFFEGPHGRTMYSTNSRVFALKLGVNTRLEFVCPVKNVRTYQVILSQAR